VASTERETSLSSRLAGKTDIYPLIFHIVLSKLNQFHIYPVIIFYNLLPDIQVAVRNEVVLCCLHPNDTNGKPVFQIIISGLIVQMSFTHFGV